MSAPNIAQDTVVGRASFEEQRQIIEELAIVRNASPLVRPTTPSGLPMRVLVTAAGALGWVGDGAYRYDALDSHGNPWPAMPKLWSDLATRFAGTDPGWDSAIVNWYSADASLGWHRDLAEADHSLPIVTISIGDACSWAVRLDDDEPIHRTRLESGDITLLAGRNRMALHTVERIIPTPMFSPLSKPGRVSITLRRARATR